MQYGADVLCFCLLPSRVHGCLPFNSSTYLFGNEKQKINQWKKVHTHTNTRKHQNANVENTWFPIVELSFTLHFRNTIWLVLLLHVLWMSSLSLSHSNRLQHMPTYMQTHSVPILPFVCICIYIYTTRYYTFILDSETITNRI